MSYVLTKTIDFIAQTSYNINTPKEKQKNLQNMVYKISIAKMTAKVNKNVERKREK